MRKLAMFIAASCWLACASVAQACKPVYHADPVADFIRDARISASPGFVIFSGDIVSVSEYRNAGGDLVRDTAVRTEHWWLGSGLGLVLVRSITPKEFPPCGPPSPLAAKEGERWLIFGWARDGRIEPYTDPRVTMPLLHGHPPADMTRKLERIGRGVPRS
ncbi:hypothetical protein KK141_02750 [Dyella sp. LX-66]|uniref:hypothetical protein n=1 Tax=unclassified Dyella TaxID=2634549 RepID=UPI001BDFF7F8|nr:MULTISPECIES: hypothetical protein [unclassified Dyella]MBT2117388.1 hypothetical protein [Dyella sp. LX-1]MBT2138452.1 hypothetical protein [Dyella sp. LX-66]